MADIKSRNISNLPIAIPDVPDSPVISTATDVGTSRAFNNGSATVAFSQSTGGLPTSYTFTSSPGSFTATGTTSPLTVTGLQSGVAYSFRGTATNAAATSSLSIASNSITATTVPDVPTAVSGSNVGTGRAYNNGRADISFSPPATGGKAITSYTVTSSPGGLTGTGSASPISVTGLSSGVAYTYTVTATNANGTGSASSASGAVTATTVPQAPTIGTVTDGGTGTTVSIPFTANATGGSAITNYQFISNPATTTQTSTSNPYTFTGLTTGTAYTFTVAAINANGTSSASSASNSIAPAIPPSFESIATATGTGSSTTISFSSIPSTYKHLQLRCLVKGTPSTVQNVVGLVMRFNGDNGANYSWHEGRSDGSTAATSWNTNVTEISSTRAVMLSNASDANMHAVVIIDIHDYRETTKNKTVKIITGSEGNNNVTGQYSVVMGSGSWRSTSAISSITITNDFTQNFTTSSVFSLYGIKG